MGDYVYANFGLTCVDDTHIYIGEHTMIGPNCVLATANGLRIFLMYHNGLLAIVIGCSLVFTICIAAMIGCFLPLAAKKIGLDPALMASPLITTLVDTCSIIIYFTIATYAFHLHL